MTKDEEREKPDPDVIHPIAGYDIEIYVKPAVRNPNIIVGEFTYIADSKWLGEGNAFSWSYYIDKDHQGKGYGKSAAEAAIQILKAASPEMPIKLATEKGNEKARCLYTSLGFRLLPELDGDDLVFGL